MKRRRTLFIVVFVVLIIILAVGVGALWFIQRRGSDAQPVPTSTIGETGPVVVVTPEVETEPVVVVIQPVRRGQRVPPDAVEVRNWRIDQLPDKPVYEMTDVVGMVAVADLPVHRPLSAESVRTVILEGSDISLAIPPGKVGYAMPIRVISMVANAIHPGDYVDVMLSFSIVDVDQDYQIKYPVVLIGGEDCLAGCQPTGEQIPRIVTQYTVQRALVLGVGVWGEAVDGVQVVKLGEEEEEPVLPVVEGEEEPVPQPTPEPYLTQVTVVTLAVEPHNALVLKWATENNAALDLVLRSATDVEEFAQPEAVTLQYMIDRFQISLPPKLPHVPENEFDYDLLQDVQVPVQPSGGG